MATMTSLQNAVQNTNTRTQHQMNVMGDAYCPDVAYKILDNVCEDEDQPIFALKNEVESLYSGPMVNATPRFQFPPYPYCNCG